MDSLPNSDESTIQACKQEYMELSRTGRPGADASCFRYAWALCHSTNREDNKRGAEMAETAAAFRPPGSDPNGVTQREFMYIRAVALFKLSRYIDARQVCKDILKASPTCRQAESLKEIIEDKMVQEGLLTVSIATVGVAVLGGVIAALVKKR